MSIGSTSVRLAALSLVISSFVGFAVAQGPVGASLKLGHFATVLCYARLLDLVQDVFVLPVYSVVVPSLSLIRSYSECIRTEYCQKEIRLALLSPRLHSPTLPVARVIPCVIRLFRLHPPHPRPECGGVRLLRL